MKEEPGMADGGSKDSPKAKSKGKGKRIHLLDELRGFAVFCMIFYHAFYTVGMFFNWEWGNILVNFFSPAEPFFAGLFILISGISSNLSHSNIERGTKLFFISFAVTLVTFFAVGSDNVIRFGILHMLAICMMLYGVLAGLMKYIPMWAGFALNVILFILTFNVMYGFLGIPGIFTIDIPAAWYKTDFLYPLGFFKAGFVSSDYFPLFPWMFIFMAGAFFGRLASKNKFPKFTYKKHIPAMSFLGRHALIIYLAHQPVIFGLCIAAQQMIRVFAK